MRRELRKFGLYLGRVDLDVCVLEQDSERHVQQPTVLESKHEQDVGVTEAGRETERCLRLVAQPFRRVGRPGRLAGHARQG